MTKFQQQVLDKFVRRYVPLNESGKDFGGGIIGEALTCSFNHKGVTVGGESGREEVLNWEVSVYAVIHRALRWNGSQSVTVGFEVRILETVSWEFLSKPVGDVEGGPCSDGIAH